MPKLFSYGTLQQDNVQMATFGRLLTGQKDSLIGYQLDEIEITDPDVLAKSGKQFHPMLIKTGNAADTVQGVIFEVSDDELVQADSYEVDDYVRVMADFASGEQAWLYAIAKDNQNLT